MKRYITLDSWQLKFIAMAWMFCDHLYSTFFWGLPWLTCVGRMAFPIFAFLIVEGFFHTRNVKAYIRRLLVFALLSELPFNLMSEGGWIFPFHQNVLFSFCLSLLLLSGLEKCKGRPIVFLLASVGSVLGGFVLGIITMVDYNGFGVLMVLLFYFAKKVPIARLEKPIQLAGMLYINGSLMGGLVFPVSFLGREWELPRQGFAVFSLIFIWLYNGKRGKVSPVLQYACYAFYPLHMLVLGLILHYIVY